MATKMAGKLGAWKVQNTLVSSVDCGPIDVLAVGAHPDDLEILYWVPSTP